MSAKTALRRPRHVYVAIAALLLMPSLLMASQLASSLATGTVGAAIVIAIVAASQPIPLKHIRAAWPWIGAAIPLILLHLALAQRFGNIDIGRALGSLLLLTFMLLGSAALADLLNAMSPKHLAKLVHRSIKILLALGAWGCSGQLQPFGSSFEKPMFPFTEPSHFALFTTPVLIAACVLGTPWQRVSYIVITLIEAIIIQNMTLVCGCALAAIVCLPLRIFSLLLIVVIPIGANLDLSYYASRLDFSQDNQNLSTLVLLQGWQMLGDAWSRTSGFGLGFQQLGVNGSDVDAAVLLQALTGQELNLWDGGFNISKIVSEFGALGLLGVVAFFVVVFRAVRLLRAAVLGGQVVRPLTLVAAALAVGYSVELGIRGAGYFTPTTLLVLTALMIWVRTPQANLRPIGRAKRLLAPSGNQNIG